MKGSYDVKFLSLCINSGNRGLKFQAADDEAVKGLKTDDCSQFCGLQSTEKSGGNEGESHVRAEDRM